MFFDWLTIEQDFGQQLPILGNIAYQNVHLDTGEVGQLSQPVYKHQGSFCDVVSISIRGSVLKMSGNPSKWGRLDNLFGLTSVDLCVAVYNEILSELGLPHFTRCTKTAYLMTQKAHSKHQKVSNGAVIKELHVTSNIAVGSDNVMSYLSALSSLPYRNSVPRLHGNGCSVDWLSKKGNANLIYPTVYNKAHELELHSLQKIKNKFGDSSQEYNYLIDLIKYCKNSGVVRFEQKLKSRFLQRENLSFWGLADFSVLKKLHNDFVNLDEKMSVTAMDFLTISEQLLVSGVVETTRAANTTAMYAIQWMHGKHFDFSKSHIQIHRARLRRIGIDIAQICDVSKCSVIVAKNPRQIVKSLCEMPVRYKKPTIFKRVA